MIPGHRQSEERTSLVVVGHRSTVGRLERLDRILPAAEEILPHAETNARRWAALPLPVEFLDRRAEISMSGRIAAEQSDHTSDLGRTEGTGAGKQIADVDGSGHVSLSAKEGNKASGGSRTRNPRITNAVLCQLKLRWPVVGLGDCCGRSPEADLESLPKRRPRPVGPRPPCRPDLLEADPVVRNPEN